MKKTKLFHFTELLFKLLSVLNGFDIVSTMGNIYSQIVKTVLLTTNGYS